MPSGEKELLTAAASALVADVLRQWGRLRLRAHGCSMFPVIKSGDVLAIRHCPTQTVQPGDVVLMADGDRLFAHRLIEKRLRNDEWFLVTRGDSHWRNDPPRSASRLLGQVTAVSTNGLAWRAPSSGALAKRLYGLAVSQVTRLARRVRALVRAIPRPLLV